MNRLNESIRGRSELIDTEPNLYPYGNYLIWRELAKPIGESETLKHPECYKVYQPSTADEQGSEPSPTDYFPCPFVLEVARYYEYETAEAFCQGIEHAEAVYQAILEDFIKQKQVDADLVVTAKMLLTGKTDAP